MTLASLMPRRAFFASLAAPLAYLAGRAAVAPAAVAPAAVAEDDAMPSLTCWFVMPSEYQIAFPTERQARRLERQYPDGLLKRVDGRLVWISPMHYPAGWPKGRT